MTPGAPGDHSKLADPGSSECHNDDRPENHSEQQGYGKGQTTAEDQEGQIDALQVLQDEDEDRDQRENPNNERSPGPAEARPSLAPIRSLLRLYILLRRAVHQLVIYTPQPPQVKCRQNLESGPLVDTFQQPRTRLSATRCTPARSSTLASSSVTRARRVRV